MRTSSSAALSMKIEPQLSTSSCSCVASTANLAILATLSHDYSQSSARICPPQCRSERAGAIQTVISAALADDDPSVLESATNFTKRARIGPS